METKFDFNDPKTRERLCIMDGRLETVFARPVRRRQNELKPIRAVTAVPTNRRKMAKPERINYGKKKGIKSTLKILDDSMNTAKPLSIPSPDKMGNSVVQRWLLALATREEDPIQIARECLEVSAEEFEESQKFMREELKFLHSFSMSHSSIPQQAAEVCLVRGQHISNIWKGLQVVLSQLVNIYANEREFYLLKNDKFEYNAVKRKLIKVQKQLEKAEYEREELREELKQTKKFLDELARFNKGNDVVEHDFSLLGDPSGVDKKLKQIYDDMMKIPKRLRYSLGDDEKEKLERSNSKKKGVFDDLSETEEEQAGLHDGEDSDASEMSDDADDSADGALDNKSKANRNSNSSVKEIGSTKNTIEGKLTGEGIVNNSSSEHTSRPMQASFSRKSSITSKEERKAFKALAKLETYELSSAFANTLGKMGGEGMQNLLRDLDPTVKAELLGSLLQNVLEGNGDQVINQILNNLTNAEAKVDFIQQFVNNFSEDEIVSLLDSVVKNSNLNDNELANLVQKLIDKMTRPFVPPFIIQMVEKYLSKKDSGKLVEAIQNNTGDKISFSTDLLSDENSTSNSKESQTIIVAKDMEKVNKYLPKSIDASDSSYNQGNYDDDEEGKGASAKSSKSKNRKKKLKGRSKRSTITSISQNGSSDDKSGETNSPEEEEEGLWRRGPLPWDKYMNARKKKVKVLEINQVKDVLIGEIYLKKIMADRDIKGTGKRRSLANTVFHYFTQKYGLKKMAEEYIYALIKSIRENHENEKRLTTFGILVGVVSSKCYTPILSDVVMELLSCMFKPTQVAAMLVNGDLTFALHQDVSRAVRSVFTLSNGEDNSASTTNLLSPSSSNLSDINQESQVDRSWAIPPLYRHRLLKWVDNNACLASSLKTKDGNPVKRTNVGSGAVSVVHLDDFLEAALKTFIDKLLYDRKMLMELFMKFDDDRNGVLSYTEFSELIKQCQPSPALSEDEILDFWDEVNENDDDDDNDTITKEAFASVCVSRAINLPYWKFSDCAVEEDKDEGKQPGTTNNKEDTPGESVDNAIDINSEETKENPNNGEVDINSEETKQKLTIETY